MLYVVCTDSRRREGPHHPLEWHGVSVGVELSAQRDQLGHIAAFLLVGIGPRHRAGHAHDAAGVDDGRVGVEDARDVLLHVTPRLQVPDRLFQPPVGVAAHKWHGARLDRHGELRAGKRQHVGHGTLVVGVGEVVEGGQDVLVSSALAALNLGKAVDWVDAHVDVLLGLVHADGVLDGLVLPVKREPRDRDVARRSDAADLDHRVVIGKGFPTLADAPHKFCDGCGVGLQVIPRHDIALLGHARPS